MHFSRSGNSELELSTQMRLQYTACLNNLNIVLCEVPSWSQTLVRDDLPKATTAHLGHFEAGPNKV